MNKRELEKKVALITGASRGIGLAVAQKFASEGANLILCARHISDEMIRISKDYGVEVLLYECDVSNYLEVKTMIEKSYAHFSRIDILANIAGISIKSPDGSKIRFHEIDIEHWNEVINTNLNSMFYVSKCAVEYMINNHYGKIINMSSIVGLTNSERGPASAAYVTAKTGVIGLTRAMAYDLAEYGINVNAIAPGRIDTAMSKSNNEYYNSLHLDMIPMHRFGTPNEVANLFLFYASDKSTYITGEVTNITGGWFI